MFKRVINHKGFLKFALLLSLVYGVVLFLVQWAFTGFYGPFLNIKNLFFALLAGVVSGFFVSYGKFWGKLKQLDHKNK